MKQEVYTDSRESERGGAGVKLLIAGVILFLIGHAGYQYIPTAYQAEDFKQDMQVSVIQGVTLPRSYGKPLEIVREKLTRAANKHKLPYNRFIDVKEKGGVITARVFYQKDVPLLPFGIYTYKYVFDKSATPSGFLNQ